MPSEERIVCVHDMPHAITISQRSKYTWVAVGQYIGKDLEVVGLSAGGAARRWVTAAGYKGARKEDDKPS
jgi:hypothetical protein